jgi:hypothetical protein
MKKRTLIPLTLIALLAASTQASQEQLATSIKEARIEATRTADQLKATLDALNALSKQKEGDLRPAYSTFSAEIPKTEAASAWTRLRVKWMEGEGQQYFKNWQKTIDGMNSESLRKKAQKRLDSVQQSYDKVGASLKAAGEKFAPFLVNLADIQKALANDITPSGVKAIRGTVSSANWNHKGVESAVNSAFKEMQRMEKALSPEVK